MTRPNPSGGAPRRRRFGGRVVWALAWLLALAGPVVYLRWPDDAGWWVGLALMVPLIGLAVWRQERKGFSDGVGIADGGLWVPPP